MPGLHDAEFFICYHHILQITNYFSLLTLAYVATNEFLEIINLPNIFNFKCLYVKTYICICITKKYTHPIDLMI